MLKRFDFRCPECKTEKEHLVREGEIPICDCGLRMERMFSVSEALITPSWMKAPGSVGSSAAAVDRQARYLAGPREKADRERDERITRKQLAAQDSLKKHINEKLGAIDRGEKTIQDVVKKSA